MIEWPSCVRSEPATAPFLGNRCGDSVLSRRLAKNACKRNPNFYDAEKIFEVGMPFADYLIRLRHLRHRPGGCLLSDQWVLSGPTGLQIDVVSSCSRQAPRFHPS